MKPQKFVISKASESERDLVKKAAQLENRSMSNFVLTYSLKAAKKILEEPATPCKE